MVPVAWPETAQEPLAGSSDVTPDEITEKGRGAAVTAVGWRAALRRDVSLLLLFKAIALALLWWLFFSPAHRAVVDPAATRRHLALEAPLRPAGAESGDNGDQP
jgi:hypothetical protein